ncbi:MAG TPA: DinB family protein [Terriglobales bacterium]
MKKALYLVLALLCATAVVAQESKSTSSSNPVSDTVRSLIARQSKNLTAAAEEMPADKYSYKPTEQQMTFGTLVEHIANSNNFLCAKLANQAEPSVKISDKDPKDKLVAALKSSFAYCETALKGVQDSQLGEPVTMWGGRQAPKAAALIGLTNDWADHYGLAATYLRLNGILPPTAKKPPAAEKK